MSANVKLGVVRDFEIIWINQDTKELIDILDPTLEIVHYDSALGATVTSTEVEPFILIENQNNTLQINVSGYPTETFSILATEASGGVTGCPVNNLKIAGTGSKIAVVEGNLAVALSACELANLISSKATNFRAEVEDGFVKIISNIQNESSLTIGNGNMNSLLGITAGQSATGKAIEEIVDLPPTTMTRISQGIFAFTYLIDSSFLVNERYFVRYRGVDPTSFTNELLEEDFTVIDPVDPANGGSSTSQCCGVVVSFCE